jgi:hypothetical protein
MADTALRMGETSLVTFTFSEAVTGFANGDITVHSGTLSPVSSSDGGRTWTATFTPTTDLEDASNVISVANGSYTDVAGNTGSAGSSANYTVDTKAPTLTITDNVVSAVTNGPITFTFTFSEDVTGFTADDVTVTANGTKGTFTAVSARVYTLVVTPQGGSTDSVGVAVLDQVASDAAGNPNLVGANASQGYDTQAPTVAITMADTALRIGETSLVTFTFSEAVTGFANGDITVQNGTLSTVTSSDGGITWTATFTPTSNITDTSNVISVTNASYTDAVGNNGASGSSTNYTVDTVAPTVTISLDDSALRIGETALVTFTFSEAVTGFANGDITVQNGTLSTVSSSDGGITWRGTFTPTSAITDSTNVITVANGSYTDVAGNTGAAGSSSNYAIDTVAPTVTITMADTALRIGDTSLVTFTFSEAVQEFTNSDITVENGSLSTVTSSDGGITWRGTFTPNSNVEDTSNVITVANASYTDVAGNTGLGVSSLNYSIDTQAPTVALALTAITDDQAPTTGTITNRTSSNDRLPTLNGTLGGPTVGASLPTGDVIAIYRSPNMVGATTVTPNNLSNGQIVGSKVHFESFNGNWAPVVKLPTNPANGDTVSLTRSSDWDFSIEANGAVLLPSIGPGVTRFFTYIAAESRWADSFEQIGTATLTTVPGGQSTWTFQETTVLPQGGVFNYAARLVDAAGNVGGYTRDYRFTVDANATITAISDDTSAPGDFVTSDTTLTVTGTNVALAAGDKVQVSFNGTNWFDVTQSTATSWTYTASAQALGNYTLRARVLGGGGVSGTAHTVPLTIEPTAIDASAYNTTSLNKTSSRVQALDAFEIDGVRYLMAANATSATSTLYRWNGSDFVVHQNLTVTNANDVRAFAVDGVRYLVAGNGPSLVFRWDSVSSQFVSHQSLPSSQAYDYELFILGGVQYMAVSELSTATSRVYRWAGNQFELAQTLTTSASGAGEVGARDMRHFSIGGEQYLLASTNVTTDPTRVFRWNSATGQFVVHQDMANSTAGMDAEVVTIGSNHYLLQVNISGGTLVYQWNNSTGLFNTTALQTITANNNAPFELETFQINGQTFFLLANIGGSVSPLYRWNGSSFVHVQNMTSNDARDWAVFDMGGEQYLVNASYLGDYIRFYRFDLATGQLVAANQTTLALGTNEDMLLSVTASQLLGNDGGATSITAVSANAVDSAGVVYGTVSLSGGNVVFTPNATADGLNKGDIKEVFFTYTNNTGAVRSVKVNITGVDNDASGFSGVGHRYDLSAAGNQTLSLNVEDVVRADGQGMGGYNQFNTGNGWTAGTYALGATEARYQMVVDGNAGDALRFVATVGQTGSWSDAGTVTNSGVTYRVYNHSAGTAQVLMRNGMTAPDTTAPVLDLNTSGASQNNVTAVGQALSLSRAINQYIDLPDVQLGGDIAVSMWINPWSAPSYSSVLDFGNGPNGSNITLSYNSGSLSFAVLNGGTALGSISAANLAPLSTWTHVAVSVGADNVATMYVNGQVAGTTTLAAAPNTLTRTNTWVGRSNWDPVPFDGVIRDLRVYDDARTAQEVAADMSGISSALDPNLRLGFSFDGTTSSMVWGQAPATLVNGAMFLRAYDRPMSFDSAAGPATVVESANILSVRVTPSGLLDGSNEKLLVGNTAINANGSVTSGTATVDGTSWNWSYGGGAFTFTTSGATTSAQAQSLIRGLGYQNLADNVFEGDRSFVVAVTDVSGNVGTQTAVFSAFSILGAGSDVSISNTGSNSTGINQLTEVNGMAAANASVALSINGTQRSVTADAQGNWTYTLKQVPLVRYVMVRLDPGPDPYNADGIFHLAEVQVFRNGTNVAAGRTATTSGGGTSSAATDGATGWGVQLNGAGEHWVQIDLGGLYAADSIKVFQQAGWTGRLQNADLLTSAFDMSGFTRAQLLADATVNKSVVSSFTGGAYTYIHPNVSDPDVLVAGNNTISATSVVQGVQLSTQTNLVYNTGGQTLAPLVIDMDGNGEWTQSQIWADINTDGLTDLIDWVAPIDAILFHDKHRNGEWLDLDQVAFQSYGGNTDLEGLAWAFDTNRDGLFDARDAEFEHFALWMDLNQNAQVDANELQSLVDLGVEAIVLTSDGVAQRVGNSVVYGQTQLLFKDGSALEVFDAAVAYTSGADIAEADRQRQQAYTVI